MTQDRNQQNRGAGQSGQQQQQGSGGRQQGSQQGSGQQFQQGSGGKQQGGQQSPGGQQQAFSNQGQMPTGSDVNQQGTGIGGQTGGMRGSQQGGMSGQSQQFAQQIRPHMEVVDNRGQHVGTVDSCQGDRIKLTKSDSSQGQHRYLQLSQVESVDGGQIRLSGGAQFLS